MSALTIRPATARDIPAIARIYDDAVRYGTASFELDPPGEEDMARRMEALVSAGFPYLAAEFDNTIAGYAYAGPYRTRPAYRYTVEDSIYIADEARRKGVGRALLAQLLTESERRGFRQMVAIIGDAANVASIELHRAAGFRMIGAFENVGVKFGRWLDSVMMQRALGPGASEPP